MFSPIKWIQPRLKTLCVAFGTADITLVFLSVVGWYFLFDMAYQAQEDHIFAEYKASGNIKVHPLSPAMETLLARVPGSTIPEKVNRKEEDLRLQRTVRACGFTHGVENDIEQNFALPSALVGASMGGYGVLGILLVALSILSSSTSKKLVSRVCLIGEGVCTLIIFLAVCMLLGNGGLCPTEYYYEYFQPIYLTFVFMLTFLASYKSYEITVLIFYLTEQTKAAYKEKETNSALRRSINLPDVEESQVSLAHPDEDEDDLGDAEGRGEGGRELDDAHNNNGE